MPQLKAVAKRMRELGLRGSVKFIFDIAKQQCKQRSIRFSALSNEQVCRIIQGLLNSGSLQ
jgi:hypothetical protein